MATILHITTHMGGGVGKVLSGISCFSLKQNSSFTHRILLLEEPKNPEFFDTCRQCNVAISVAHHPSDIRTEIEAADIVQLEWWHHPRMAEFLHTFPEMPVRLIIWSHISGCSYPYLRPEFILKPHHFLFTSRYSLDNPYWTAAQKSQIKNRTSVINSSGDFSAFLTRSLESHDHFTIGYLGTLGYSKLHPEFLDFCSKISIPDLRFIMIGDLPSPNLIKADAERRQIGGMFEYHGHVSDVASELTKLDIFGYLLNPEHYGTTENALLEAMAAGLPVVALDQCAEKYLIRHGETGLLVKNNEEYAHAIHYLFDNPLERSRLGRNARDFVISEMDIPITVKKLDEVYAGVLSEEKKRYSFDDIFGSQPFQWFLSGLSRECDYFMQSMDHEVRSDPKKLACIECGIKKSQGILKGQSKSSINQYHEYFPEDVWLKYWADLLNSHDS